MKRAAVVVHNTASAQRGVSLVEALAALAVMAFGLLGVVGMQATLRSNGDVSKQRSEAVRMAQQQIEDWRSFERLPPGTASFADIATFGGTAVTGIATNATYTRLATVPNPTPGADDPKLKSLTVEVRWDDRSGSPAFVQLVSAIAGIAPELAGSLSLPADRAATQRPGGRHFAIPPGATVESGGTTSTFSPPNAPANVRWIFNNQTGLIIKTCNETGTCIDTELLPMSGFVRFATDFTAAPNGANAENPDIPVSNSVAITVRVNTSLPANVAVACFAEQFASYVSYFCAMPVTTPSPSRRWSGRTEIAGLDISSTLADFAPNNRKVCRYTPERTHTPSGGNVSHPLDHVDVTEPLANQNFLVIRAGNGTSAFDCPPDDTGTEFVNGNTYRHQPDA